ncbi:MAG: hypothetical protein ACK5LO_09440 [Leucobacter sp.]
MLTTLALITAAVLGLIGAGVLAWNTLIYVQTDHGSCLIFDPSACRSLTYETVEQDSSVALPEGSRILDSGSISAFASSRTWATVEIPEDTDLRFDPGYEPSNLGAGAPPAQFRSVDEVYVHGTGSERRLVMIGTGADGTRIVHLEVRG